MKVFLATDHAGFNLKEEIKQYLHSLNYEVVDCGAFSLDPTDDYPLFIAKAAQEIEKDPNALAIIFGKSGAGRKSLPINLKMFGRFWDFPKRISSWQENIIMPISYR